MNGMIVLLDNKNEPVSVFNHHEIGFSKVRQQERWHELWRGLDGSLWIREGFDWKEVSILDEDDWGIPIIYQVKIKTKGRSGHKVRSTEYEQSM